ncbi:MAG: hypothetical protein JSR00_03380 [Bacteroidetes bacterium]|nr:hypothetical protein [Bacteroidota bacterium]
MKKAFALILILIFSVQAFYSSALTIWFFANRAKITKEHCINKNRPEKKCNGKCYLSKKIQEAENHDKKESSPVTQIIEISYCIIPAINNLNFTPEIIFLEPVSNYNNPYKFLFSENIFHPPLLG